MEILFYWCVSFVFTIVALYFLFPTLVVAPEIRLGGAALFAAFMASRIASGIEAKNA